ncbi:uncharacterized protein LOC107884407, partial [Acyrthosiphon pisum]|uniref:Uncharacterized protein n=1 Tax=Acyrthosiphon pisum TaxID=7029 RepID=A0A8R2NTE7_ACYPI
KNKKRKGDKKKVQSYENLKTDKTILKTRKLYTETFDDNDKDLNKERTVDSNLNKGEWTRRIPIASASEGDPFIAAGCTFKKKKKKKKGDQQMVQHFEDSTNDKGTMVVDKIYDETLHDYKHLNKNKPRDSNLNEDELTKSIPIASAPEGYSFIAAGCTFKKKKKKKKGDQQMVQHFEDSTNDKGTMVVDKIYDETLHDYKHLNKNKPRDSNLNEDELTKSIPIASAPEGYSLFKKKKKKKKGDQQMVQHFEDLTNDKGTMNVDKIYDEALHDYKHLNKNKPRDSNLNKDELTKSIPIASAPEGYSLFKKKKKKKKGDQQKVQHFEDSTNDKGTMVVDKIYDETLHDYKHLNKNKPRDSNLNEDELTKSIPIASAPEGYSLFKKKKKKKKGDQQKVQHFEDSTNEKGTMIVDKIYDETLHDYKHLNKSKPRDSNLNKDKLTKSIPIASAPEGYSLFKKKKKKKKGDQQKVQHFEDSTNDKGTMIVDKIYDETLHDYKHLNKNKPRDSNLNEDELTKSIPIASAPEGYSLFKKKKKKKKGDQQKVQHFEDSTNDKGTMIVDKIYDETLHDYKHLNKSKPRDSNLNEDELTKSIHIASAPEGYSLLKSSLKITKKISKMAIKADTESSKYESIQIVFKNMEYLNKDISEEQSNDIHYGSAMINAQYNSRISKAHEQYPELFQKLLKKKKK